MLKSRRAKYFFLGVLGFLLVSCSALSTFLAHGGNMTSTAPQFAQIFDKTKTICVGRFLVDVPVSAHVVYGPADVEVKTERYAGKGSDIDALVAARLAAIESDRAYASGALRAPMSLVGTVRPGSAPDQKIVFGVSESSGAFYRIESYLKVGQDLFIQEGNAYGATNEHEELVRTMNFIAPLILPRLDDVTPVGQGICIDGGFISGPSKLSYENLTLGVRLAEYADVHFSLSTSLKPFVIESDALEPRLQQAEQMAQRSGNGAWYSRIKTLRRGQRQIGKWIGFEVLARKPSQANEGESHEFAFLSQGEPNNPMLPVLDLSLHTGVKGNTTGGARPSITDDEALMLWDKLTSSIRARPVHQ
nr:T6SS immunity protein Tli4 family protein [uncultured Duganella sp.]